MRKSFTIIELMVSISIIILINVYLFYSLDTVKKSNLTLEKNLVVKTKKLKLFKLIYEDIFKAFSVEELNSKNSDNFHILKLKSPNSLYKIINPYIIYFVADKKLYRFESLKDINLENKSFIDSPFKVEKLIDNVDIFNVYINEDNNIFFYLKADDEIFFEIIKI